MPLDKATLVRFFGASYDRVREASPEENAHEKVRSSKAGKASRFVHSILQFGDLKSNVMPAHVRSFRPQRDEDKPTPGNDVPFPTQTVGGTQNLGGALGNTPPVAEAPPPIGAELCIDECLMREVQALNKAGLLPPEQLAAVSQLGKRHQDYLRSDEGILALQQARESGRVIDIKKFAQIPESVLEPHPQFPSPLFRMAIGSENLAMNVWEYQAALTNARDCNIFDVGQMAPDGRNPFHVAALHGNLGAIQAFVKSDQNADPKLKKRPLNAVTKGGQSPLEIAVRSGKPGAALIVEELASSGAILVSKDRKHGLLQRAVRSGDPAVVEAMAYALTNSGVRYGKDKSGETPQAARRAWLKSLGSRAAQHAPASLEIDKILDSYKAESKPGGGSPKPAQPFASWTAIELEE